MKLICRFKGCVSQHWFKYKLDSKGEPIKLDRMKTKSQKTRNFYFFSAFDMAKEKFGEADVSIDTKMSIRTLKFKGDTLFELGEFSLSGRFVGLASGWKIEDKKGK